MSSYHLNQEMLSSHLCHFPVTKNTALFAHTTDGDDMDEMNTSKSRWVRTFQGLESQAPCLDISCLIGSNRLVTELSSLLSVKKKKSNHLLNYRQVADIVKKCKRDLGCFLVKSYTLSWHENLLERLGNQITKFLIKNKIIIITTVVIVIR